MMKLSDNFYLNEFTKSSTAARLGIDNSPCHEVTMNLQILAVRLLQPVREYYGRAVLINSGFRSRALNDELGSSPSSQHRTGEAADFEINGLDNYAVACWVRDNLEYDQLILEFYDGSPDSGWIHVSLNADKVPRMECLTIDPRGQVKRGLVK